MNDNKLIDIPDWVAKEIRDTWTTAKSSGGAIEAYRILERMVERLGYGRYKNINCPSLGIKK